MECGHHIPRAQVHGATAPACLAHGHFQTCWAIGGITLPHLDPSVVWWEDFHEAWWLSRSWFPVRFWLSSKRGEFETQDKGLSTVSETQLVEALSWTSSSGGWGAVPQATGANGASWLRGNGQEGCVASVGTPSLCIVSIFHPSHGCCSCFLCSV